MSAPKTVLVTGSSRGIGAAIARKLHQTGYSVIVHGKSDTAELNEVTRELAARHIVFDVADEKAVQKALSGEKIDVLVNNAGINPSKTFLQLTERDWRDIFDTNVFGLVNVSRAVLPGMIKRKSGKIVNIASIKGFAHVSGKPAYAASKAAVMRITTSMAEEFAGYGIQINAVAPGFTKTDMTDRTLSSAIETQIKSIPMGRMATPEEIAETVIFLASEKSDYITGQIIAVDGGYSIT